MLSKAPSCYGSNRGLELYLSRDCYGSTGLEVFCLLIGHRYESFDLATSTPTYAHLLSLIQEERE